MQSEVVRLEVNLERTQEILISLRQRASQSRMFLLPKQFAYSLIEQVTFALGECGVPKAPKFPYTTNQIKASFLISPPQHFFNYARTTQRSLILILLTLKLVLSSS